MARDSRAGTCRCGRQVDPLVRGQGWWHALWAAALAPLVTLALYALLVAVALRLLGQGAGLPAILVLTPIPLAWLVALGALALSGHRGWCLAGRSLSWFLAWPGHAAAAVAGF